MKGKSNGAGSPMRILALDLGSTTGWAISGSPPLTGRWEVRAGNGESPGMRLIRFRADLNRILEAYPDLKLLVVEKVHVRYATAALSLGELVGRVKEWAAEKGIELTWVPASTVKKFATGRGQADKAAMMAAATAKGWFYHGDDNEADARWLLEYAEQEIVG